MNAILDQLNKDHVNVSRLIDFLDEAPLTLDDLPIHRWDSVRDIMHYMIHYPDLLHHPNEDLIFRKLMIRDPAASPMIQGLIDEHAVIGKKSTLLFDLLGETNDEQGEQRGEVIDQIGEYVVLMRGHINKEEGEIFPLAKVLLTPDDWESIVRQVKNQADPLFGPVVSSAYAKLKRKILYR